VRGLNCPLPILRANESLGGVGERAGTSVLATDPGSGEGLSGFRRSRPATQLLSHDEADKIFTFFMKKR